MRSAGISSGIPALTWAEMMLNVQDRVERGSKLAAVVDMIVDWWRANRCGGMMSVVCELIVV